MKATSRAERRVTDSIGEGSSPTPRIFRQKSWKKESFITPSHSFDDNTNARNIYQQCPSLHPIRRTVYPNLLDMGSHDLPLFPMIDDETGDENRNSDLPCRIRLKMKPSDASSVLPASFR